VKAERLCLLTVVLPCVAGLQLWVISMCSLALSSSVLSSSALAAQITVGWDRTNDPAVAGYILYYGSASGDYEGAIDVGMEVTYTLTDLEDGKPYYFTITAYDMNGNEGESLEEIVHDRSMVGSEADQEGNGLIDGEEDNADGGGSTDEEVTQIADAGEEDDHLSDPVESASDQEEPPEAASADGAIPQSQLSIIFVDSEPFVGDGAAEAAIDGQPETFWRTDMGAKAPRHPHELVIDLGGSYNVRGFRYLPRQDGSLDGTVARFSFYVIEDEGDWGKAVAAGTFSRDAAEKEVVFPERIGSFVRLVAHSEINGKPWTSIAEITVLGTP
jgi:hypothetical protein